MPLRVRYWVAAEQVWRSTDPAERDVAPGGVVEPPPPEAGAPGEVSYLNAVAPSLLYNTARVMWDPPTDDGGSPVTFYDVRVVGQSTIQQVLAPNETFDWTSLAGGVSVRFEVRAHNAVGPGPWRQSPTMTPTSPPTTPPTGGTLFGWDPTTWVAPAERSYETWPFHNNTGLYRDEDMAALRAHTGDFITSAANQRVERLDITGKVQVRHPGVVFKLCRIRDQIVSETIGAGTPPVFIYCDLAFRLGAASTSLTNLTKGHGLFYACNIWGWIDGISLKTSASSASPTSLMRDCFVHDPRVALDDFYSPPDASHSDYFGQSNQSGRKWNIIHCTGFASNMDNMPGKSMSATRDSSQRWSGSSPLTVTFPGAGSGGEAAGRVNTGVMVKAGSNARVELRRSLMRGYTYRHVTPTSGNQLYATDNLVAPEETEQRTAPMGNPNNFTEWRNNVRYDTRRPW